MALFCGSGFSRDAIPSDRSKIAAEAAPTEICPYRIQDVGLNLD